jgi:hypothetical protein
MACLQNSSIIYTAPGPEAPHSVSPWLNMNRDLLKSEICFLTRMGSRFQRVWRVGDLGILIIIALNHQFSTRQLIDSPDKKRDDTSDDMLTK